MEPIAHRKREILFCKCPKRKRDFKVSFRSWNYLLATDNENKWQNILQLYNQLILTEYSPIPALNRTFAFSKVYGQEKAIVEAEKLKLTENNQYQELLGYLYSQLNIPNAIEHYKNAIQLTKSETEKRTLKKEIERLKRKNGR